MTTTLSTSSCSSRDGLPLQSHSAPLLEEIIQCSGWDNFMGNIDAKCVDLILTDPPYTISRETGFAKVKNGVDRFAVSMDFGDWDHMQIDLQTFCSEAYRVLRVGGTAIIWYDIWKIGELKGAMENAGFKMIRLIIWQKTNPVPLNQRATYLSNSREVAVCGVRGGKPTFHNEYDNGIYSMPIPRPKGGRVHPTQKPIKLFKELVAKHSIKGDLIIDPFLGSGTTAEATLSQGRRFAGCDIDANYVSASRNRAERLYLG